MLLIISQLFTWPPCALIQSRLLHSKHYYTEPPNSITHGHNFMAGNSFVHTRLQNHAVGHCGETGAFKITQRPVLYPCCNKWDVLMWLIGLCHSLGRVSPYKGFALGRWWASQVIGDTTMIPILVSIPITRPVSFVVCPLTHWGRATHIYVNKLAIIGSDNGLSLGRRQAIIWTNAGILFIGPLGTNFGEISIEI